MSSVASGTVVQNTLDGGSLLYTDTGTYGTVSSRILTVYDYQSNIVQVFDMGVNLTQVFTFNSDAWFWFQCVVIDNTGTFTANVYTVADGFFWETYAEQFTSTACGCQGNNCNLDVGLQCLYAALRFNLAGQSGAAAAQRNIVAANYFVNLNAVVTI